VSDDLPTTGVHRTHHVGELLGRNVKFAVPGPGGGEVDRRVVEVEGDRGRAAAAAVHEDLHPRDREAAVGRAVETAVDDPTATLRPSVTATPGAIENPSSTVITTPSWRTRSAPAGARSVDGSGSVGVGDPSGSPASSTTRGAVVASGEVGREGRRGAAG
jgi:hypothetical protein